MRMGAGGRAWLGRGASSGRARPPLCVCACARVCRCPAGRGDVQPGLRAGHGNGQSAVPVAGKADPVGHAGLGVGYATHCGDVGPGKRDGAPLAGFFQAGANRGQAWIWPLRVSGDVKRTGRRDPRENGRRDGGP